MKNPSITVLMPVFNAEKYIREAVDSILNQSFTDFEFLIVNDGSTDRTVEIIRTYSDTRIRLIEQPNGGVSSALNFGLKEALGEYIARFDADDISYLGRLESQYNFIVKNPEYILIGSDVDYITEEGKFIFNFKNVSYTNTEIGETIMKSCPFVHSSVFYKKDIVLRLGGYEVKAHTFEDYFLWVKLIKEGKVCNLKETLIKVRFNSSSVTIDERDHQSIFLKLKKKALVSGVISDEEGKLILNSIVKLGKRKKEGSYYRMLGKKYLWNNYQPNVSRTHLVKSILQEPLSLTSYTLFFISFLPKNFIKWVYSKNKSY